jgi:hypothetical protein
MPRVNLVRVRVQPGGIPPRLLHLRLRFSNFLRVRDLFHYDLNWR